MVAMMAGKLVERLVDLKAENLVARLGYLWVAKMVAQ
jgi:hypothetical protein